MTFLRLRCIFRGGCLSHFEWEEKGYHACWWCPLCGSNVSSGRSL